MGPATFEHALHAASGAQADDAVEACRRQPSSASVAKPLGLRGREWVEVDAVLMHAKVALVAEHDAVFLALRVGGNTKTTRQAMPLQTAGAQNTC